MARFSIDLSTYEANGRRLSTNSTTEDTEIKENKTKKNKRNSKTSLINNSFKMSKAKKMN